MSVRNKFAVAATALALGAAVLAAAPNAGAVTGTSQVTQSTSSTASVSAHRVVRVESGHSAVHSETMAQFQAKAASAGATITHPNTVQGALVSSAYISCWYWDDWRKGYGIFGQLEWTFNVEPNWCGDGTWITSAYNDTWGETSWPGWSYEGLTQSINRYGAGWNVYENIRQGHFCLASYFSCVQNYYPYVDVEVGGGGQIYKW